LQIATQIHLRLQLKCGKQQWQPLYSVQYTVYSVLPGGAT